MTTVLITRRFWLDAIERAVKTFAQTVAGVAVGASVADIGASWKVWVASAGIAAATSILTSIASAGQSDSISPASLVPPV